MRTPKVSVLIPIYNVEKYLRECLDTVVAQTLKDIEIICINDGSTDSSLKIIKEYAKSDSRIVVVNKKNSGYGDSMNKGLKKATGEYVGIVESDDWVELNAFEKMYDLAIQNDAEVVKANFYNYFTNPEKKYVNGTITKIVNPDEIGRIIDTTVNRSIMWQQPAIWSAIYKNEFLRKHDIKFLPSPGASYQDAGFNFKIWANAKRVLFTEDAFLHYRQDNESSSINNPGKVFCITDEYEEIEKYLKRHDIYENFKDTMLSTKWGGYSWNIERLAPELAQDFIYKASEEYKAAYESGDFIFANFDVNWARALTEVMHQPEMAVKRKFASYQARVSIIVPVYNIESYLPRCLDALIKQSMKEIEIIIVDDGSTDSSSDIIGTYYTNDPRIQIIHQHNQGLAAARNTGMLRAHADYIMFCDSDDYYELDSVETMFTAILTNEADMVSGSANVVYEAKDFTAQQKHEDMQYFSTKLKGLHDISDPILRRVDVSTWNKIYKRSVINNYQIRFPAGLYYEDTYFFYAYAWSSANIFFLPLSKVVYNYVRRNGSIMSETFKKTPRAYDHTEIIIRLFRFMKDRDIFPQHVSIFKELFTEYFALSLKYLPEESKGFLRTRVQEFDENFGAYIASIDPEARMVIHECLKSMDHSEQPQLAEPVALNMVERMKRLAKLPFKALFYPYRNGRRVLNDIQHLHQKIEHMEQQQKDMSNRLSAIIRELNKQH